MLPDDKDYAEEVAFFGQDRQRMFGCLHLPAGPVVAGVIICPSLQSEFLANYRREVLLARSLAARGYAVQRFHYWGTGNSDGETWEATFDTMRVDAMTAARRLTRRTGVTRLVFVGIRWGALVAAAAAATVDGAHLALWEPAVSGSRFFREVFRSRLIHDLRSSPEHPQGGYPADELRTNGTVDVLGFSIDRPTYESAQGRTLAGELGDDPRWILLIQIDRSQRLRAEYASLVDHWKALNFQVDVRLVRGQEAWWFPGVRWQERETLRRGEMLVRLTTDWVVALGQEEGS